MAKRTRRIQLSFKFSHLGVFLRGLLRLKDIQPGADIIYIPVLAGGSLQHDLGCYRGDETAAPAALDGSSQVVQGFTVSPGFASFPFIHAARALEIDGFRRVAAVTLVFVPESRDIIFKRFDPAGWVAATTGERFGGIAAGIRVSRAVRGEETGGIRRNGVPGIRMIVSPDPVHQPPEKIPARGVGGWRSGLSARE
jgi:hypothetical protein